MAKDTTDQFIGGDIEGLAKSGDKRRSKTKTHTPQSTTPTTPAWAPVADTDQSMGREFVQVTYGDLEKGECFSRQIGPFTYICHTKHEEPGQEKDFDATFPVWIFREISKEAA